MTCPQCRTVCTHDELIRLHLGVATESDTERFKTNEQLYDIKMHKHAQYMEKFQKHEELSQLYEEKNRKLKELAQLHEANIQRMQNYEEKNQLTHESIQKHEEKLQELSQHIKQKLENVSEEKPETDANDRKERPACEMR